MTIACARLTASRSLAPATLYDNRAFTPMIVFRLRSIAARAAPTSARLMSIVSPSGKMPARPTLISTRPTFGAALALATDSSTLSAPLDPASSQHVTPSERVIGAFARSRPQCV